MTLENIIRVSVTEAARLFGVNQRTVRRALAAGDVQYILVRGRYKISFESLVRWSQQKPTVQNKNNRLGLGQFVEKWRIRNTHYSPNPDVLKRKIKRRQRKMKSE